MSPKSSRRPRSPRGPKRVPRANEARSTSTPRYTPPIKHVRFRPAWHRVVGAVELLLGVAVIAVNYAQYETAILPGGHNELYFLVGLGIGAGSLWWFGAFDRPR